MDILTVIGSMGSLVLVTLIGYVAARAGFLTSEVRPKLSALIFNVTLPCTILASVGEVDSSAGTEQVTWSFVLGTALFFVMLVAAALACLALRAPRDERPLYLFMGVLTNTGFIGFAVLESLFGGGSVFLGSIFIAVSNVFLYSIGVGVLTSGGEKDDEKKGFITGKLIVDKNITPLEFFHKYCSVDLNNYVDVADAPHKEYGKLYELRRSSNMVAGHENQFANMGMDVIKKAVIAQLKAGHPAWFACDCEPFSLRRMGVFDRKSVNVEALFDVEYKLDKADRLRFGESLGNHAMTIQGVDLDENGNPTRWKIENSWGKMVGENGYFVMSDEWFSDFVYDVALRREFLDADTLAVANSKPVELEPWDPFCKATRCIA